MPSFLSPAQFSLLSGCPHSLASTSRWVLAYLASFFHRSFSSVPGAPYNTVSAIICCIGCLFVGLPQYSWPFKPTAVPKTLIWRTQRGFYSSTCKNLKAMRQSLTKLLQVEFPIWILYPRLVACEVSTGRQWCCYTVLCYRANCALVRVNEQIQEPHEMAATVLR